MLLEDTFISKSSIWPYPCIIQQIIFLMWGESACIAFRQPCHEVRRAGGCQPGWLSKFELVICYGTLYNCGALFEICSAVKGPGPDTKSAISRSAGFHISHSLRNKTQIASLTGGDAADGREALGFTGSDIPTSRQRAFKEVEGKLPLAGSFRTGSIVRTWQNLGLMR